MCNLKKFSVNLSILVVLLMVFPFLAKASPTPPTSPPPVPEFWLKVYEGEKQEEWSPASIDYDSNFLKLEMHPSNRPSPTWGELLSLSFEKTPEPLELFVEKWLTSLKKEDPTLRSKQTTVEGHVPGFVVACESLRREEVSISRLVQIREGILVLTYRAKSKQVSKESLVEWVSKIKKAELVRSDGAIPPSVFMGRP
jgi:hypothetical protein